MTRTSMRPGPVLLAAAIALLALSAATPAGARTLEGVVYLHEDPLHVAPEAINAQVGDTITLTVINTGQSRHDLVVCGEAPSGSSLCSEKLAFTPMLEPGGEAPITFTVDRAGTFEYFCSVPGHKAGGMVGRLVVSGGEEKKESPGLAVPGALAALGALALLRARRGAA